MGRLLIFEPRVRPDVTWCEVRGSCATVPLAEPSPAPVIRLPARPRARAKGRSGRFVLTRRGRLARTLAVTFAAALLVLSLMARLGDPGPLVTARIATVAPGQTLGDVAAAELPGLPLPEAVRMLRVFNELPGVTVRPGQSLRIPAL